MVPVLIGILLGFLFFLSFLTGVVFAGKEGLPKGRKEGSSRYALQTEEIKNAIQIIKANEAEIQKQIDTTRFGSD